MSSLNEHTFCNRYTQGPDTVLPMMHAVVVGVIYVVSIYSRPSPHYTHFYNEKKTRMTFLQTHTDTQTHDNTTKKKKKTQI